MSLNGIIARENNEEDFISNDSWEEWLRWIREAGCVIWGRKTHEVVKTWGKQYIDDIRGVRAMVVSSNQNFEAGDGFELASSPKEALEKLQIAGSNTVILSGGSTLNTSFAKAGLIDEVVLNVEPVLIGKGIPLFFPQEFNLKLKLLSTKKITEHIVQLHYEVEK